MTFANLTFACLAVITLPIVAHAGFVPLVGIPGIDAPDDLNDVVNTIYLLAISIAALLAVIKIIIAGVKYMLSDVVTTKQDAKSDIWGALIGLLVVVSAVLILLTINPQLVNIPVGLKEEEGGALKNVDEVLDIDAIETVPCWRDRPRFDPNTDGGPATLEASEHCADVRLWCETELGGVALEEANPTAPPATQIVCAEPAAGAGAAGAPAGDALADDAAGGGDGSLAGGGGTDDLGGGGDDGPTVAADDPDFEEGGSGPGGGVVVGGGDSGGGVADDDLAGGAGDDVADDGGGFVDGILDFFGLGGDDADAGIGDTPGTPPTPDSGGDAGSGDTSTDTGGATSDGTGGDTTDAGGTTDGGGTSGTGGDTDGGTEGGTGGDSSPDAGGPGDTPDDPPTPDTGGGTGDTDAGTGDTDTGGPSGDIGDTPGTPPATDSGADTGGDTTDAGGTTDGDGTSDSGVGGSGLGSNLPPAPGDTLPLSP